MIQDATNARAQAKLAVIEKAICEVGYRLVSLAKQYLTGEQVARVVGPQGAAVWVPFEAHELTDEIDLDVEGGSTAPKNEVFRQKQMMDLLGQLGPMIGTVIDPKFVAKEILSSFGITNPDQYMMPTMPQVPGQMMPSNAPQAQLPQPARPQGQAPGPQAPMAPGVPPQTPDVPPNVLAQLHGQVGLPSLPHVASA